MSDSVAELFCSESMGMESMGMESMGVESMYASIKTPYTRVEEESIFFYTELGEYYLAKTSEVHGGIEYTYESLAKNELPFTFFIEYATEAELAEFEEFVE